MKACTTAAAAVVVVVVVLLLGEANVSVDAAICNPRDLNVCSAAFSSNSRPPPACCTKIKEQKPCYCQYIKDPSIGPLLRSPNAVRVARQCRVVFPRC